MPKKRNVQHVYRCSWFVLGNKGNNINIKIMYTYNVLYFCNGKHTTMRWNKIEV